MSIRYTLKHLYEEGSPLLREVVGFAAGVVSPSVRYGPAFREALRTSHDSDSWSDERLEAELIRRLREVLALASRTSYWPGQLEGMPFHASDFNHLNDLERVPLLTRADVRRIAEGLRPDGISSRSWKFSTTGGTSGRPLGLAVTHDASSAEWAMMNWLWGRVGYRPGDRRVVIRGRRVQGRGAGRLWELDRANHAMYVSSFDLSARNSREIIEAIQDFKPQWIHAYPSSATVLARLISRTASRFIPLNGLLLGSENLYAGQRSFLEESFRTRVYNWYGHTEKCILAGECEHQNGYHVVPTYGYCELVDGTGSPIRKAGQRGVLVGTGFINQATVLIRYLTDDESEWLDGPCPCGRTSPRIGRVEGRWHQEMLVGKDGALIPMAAINLHTAAYARIDAFQFRQTTPGEAEFRFVPGAGFTLQDEEAITGELRAKLESEIDLTLTRVDDIARTKAGKFNFIEQELRVDYPMFAEGPGTDH